MHTLGNGCDLYVSAGGLYQVMIFPRAGMYFLHTLVQELTSFYSKADPWDYHADNSRMLGVCTGALAAAAVSCSRSVLELVPMAVDAVTVAFRTGMHVMDVAQRIEPSDATDQSWSIIVPGSASAEAVRKLCKESVRTLSYVLYFTTSSLRS